LHIYLLRHGIAAPLNEENRFNDARRALTPDGLAKMREACLGLKRLGVTFDLVASSPLVRAKQTAEIVVGTLRIGEPIQEWDELTPDGSIGGVMRQLQKYEKRASPLLVGHQPFMGLLACFLIFGSNKISLDFKKGGICCIRVDEVPPQFAGELVWMLPPKILRAFGEK
jgi:phosphohistidine phosphatase